MIKNKIPLKRNIAFIHVPRTAGTFVNGYLSQKIFLKNNYCILNSWKTMQRDWSTHELLSFLAKGSQIKYVHNHKENWPKEIITQYKKEKWFTFSFIRHPGDRLCSVYYKWEIEKKKEAKTLNEFLKKSFTEGLPQEKDSTIPEYWKEIDFIDEFTPKNFAKFLKDFFNHEYESTYPVNTTENKGYEYYRDRGEITDEVDTLLKK